ncbi:Uncharacterised protein [uncultured archaeon]|nr:Uncharacterised protein [uncultured archaeon]
MAISFKSLKTSIISKVKRKLGEFMLPKEKQALIKKLFAPSKEDQLEAATELGKSPDMEILSLLHFYLQDSFLEELMGSLPGGEFKLDLAEKKAIKFYSLMAAAFMLSDRPFFSYVMQAISSRNEPTEERCDLIYITGSVYEAFGMELHSKEGALASEESGQAYVNALVAILKEENEPEEVKVASALSLKKALSNPNISTALPVPLAKEAFAQLSTYRDVLSS